MKEKEVVIIVPGTKGLSKWPRFIQIIASFFAKICGIKPVYFDHATIWQRKINSIKRKVIWLHWSRGISILSLGLARRKLKRLLKHYKSYKVKLIGISFGGDIILKTIRKDKFPNVKKIILIGSINKEKEITFGSPPIVNIYSKKDHLAEFVIGLLSPLNGRKALNGRNVKNVVIPSMTHKDFCYDNVIKKGEFKGKSILGLVNFFLKD